MPPIAPLAVLFAFLLNALNCAIAVDNAQMHVTYFEPGLRGNPGPAAIERSEPVDLSNVVLFARSGAEPVATEPSRRVALRGFEHLAGPAARPQVAAMPYVQSCVSLTRPQDPFRGAPRGLPLLQDNRLACQPTEEPAGRLTAQHP